MPPSSADADQSLHSADVRIDLPGVLYMVAEELLRNTGRVCPYAKMAHHGIVCVVALVR